MSEFRRTTSNSFVTSSQYAIVETTPNINDRRVLEAIKAHLLQDDDAANNTATSSHHHTSMVDPFTTTVKDRLTKERIHHFLWQSVLGKFRLMDPKKVTPKPSQKIPKKVEIQLDNTLRRLRGPDDKALLRNSEPLEIHIAWHLVRIFRGNNLADFITSVRALQVLREGAGRFIQDDVRQMVQPIIDEKLETMWEFLMENEYLLTTQQDRVTLYPSQLKVRRWAPPPLNPPFRERVGRVYLVYLLLTISPLITYHHFLGGRCVLPFSSWR